MNNINDIIKFYRDCYLHDFKAISVGNFFGRNVEFQYYLNSSEPFNGKLLNYPVDSEWGVKMDEELAINSKEKGLYAGAFFIKGETTILGRISKVFAPLYLYEVHLHLDNDVYSVELELNNPIINPAFFDFFKSISPDFDITYDAFADNFPKDVLNFDNLFLLKEQLKKFFPSLKINSIDKWMGTDFIKNNLKTIYQSKSTKYDMQLIAAAMIGLIKKPKGSRGVINELTTLSERNIEKGILTAMFDTQEITQNPKFKKRSINVPVSLSESQKQVFQSTCNSSTTLVIGPPGTGKSFTIAALTSELISRGKSVLIASKHNQAGKVISDKIENDMGLKGLVIKTAKQSYKRSLRTRLTNILNGISIKKVSAAKLSVIEKEIANLDSKIASATKQLERREVKEIKWGRFFYNYKPGIFSNLKRKWITYSHDRQMSIWRVKQNIDFLKKKRIKHLRKYIEDRYNLSLRNNLLKKRNQVQYLVKALEEKAGNLIHQEFDKIDFDVLFKALPAWICNTSDIHNILPLKQNLFDVVIIDEATQCDIASTIPLIYRAKKVVIVGDPKQLRHVSFLSKLQERILREKYNLNNDILGYRKNSILDLVNNSIQNQDQVVFLNEHYRSLPDIIRFSNRQFYADNLNILTTSPLNDDLEHIYIKKVNGTRDEKGINREEAKFIVKEIRKLIADDASIGTNLNKSIGIISPFRAQVNYLKTYIRKVISLNDLKQHNVLIGTPFQFQGEERDFIFLSFVVDDNAHPSSLMYLNKEDVLNVSITRARNKQVICTSMDYKNLNEKYLLSQYLNSIGQFEFEEKRIKPKDQFADEIIDHIKSYYDILLVLKSFLVAGVVIDIVAEKFNKTYCIDLVGHPGVYEKQFTPTNLKKLNRMNHPVFFLSYSSWILDRKKCEQDLRQFLEEEEE